MSTDLDALQRETEMLLALLKDRQPGLFTWTIMLHERLKAIGEFAPSPRDDGEKT